MDSFWKRYRGLMAAAVIMIVTVLGAIYLARRPEPRPVAIFTPAPRPTMTPAKVLVDVRGAVAAPGVYALARGSRVQDALAAAGGPTQEANVERLNLAKLLSDGDQVVVPARPATVTPPAAAAAATAPAASATEGEGTPAAGAVRAIATGPAAAPKVNLNTATVEALDALPGIGPALAGRIVEYRQQNGPFKAIEEIKNVKGIGDAIFAQIKDLIAVE